MDFHGQPHARFTRGQTVYSELNHERSLPFKLLSLLLFLARNSYLRGIEILSSDGFTFFMAWESFMNELLQGWTDVLLPVMQLDLDFQHQAHDYSPVDRHAFSHRELCCHPRRRPLQSQREQCDNSESSHYFHVSCPDCEHPLDSSQCRKHYD